MCGYGLNRVTLLYIANILMNWDRPVSGCCI